jgi:mannose-6-phosphate isomerase
VADFAGAEPMVLIMLAGSGELNGAPITAGETWLLPGAAEHWNWTCANRSEWIFLLAQPPVRST